MTYCIAVGKEDACSRATLPISYKNALEVCAAINKQKLADAKKILGELVAQKKSIRGKFYTNAAKQILKLLEGAEKNALARNIAADNLYIKTISAGKGERLYRARRKRAFGYQLKSTNVQVILEKKEQ